MSAKGTDQTSLNRAIAELEAIDTALSAIAAHLPVAEARLHLRAAITSLSATRGPVDDTGTTKRRVKIKAASDAPATRPVEAARASAPARSATSQKGAGKAGAKRNDRTPVSNEVMQSPKGLTHSLLARLDAAVPPSSTPAPAASSTAPPPPAGPPAAGAPGEIKGISAEDAVSRLARLEAEIASLTEPSASLAARDGDKRSPASASKSSTSPTNTTPNGAARKLPPAAPSPDTSFDDEEEDAEITIVGADASTSATSTVAERQTPRVYRDAASPAVDEAEVEIIGPDAQQRRSSGSPPASGATKDTAPARWRLFRGSR